VQPHYGIQVKSSKEKKEKLENKDSACDCSCQGTDMVLLRNLRKFQGR